MARVMVSTREDQRSSALAFGRPPELRDFSEVFRVLGFRFTEKKCEGWSQLGLPNKIYQETQALLGSSSRQL